MTLVEMRDEVVSQIKKAFEENKKIHIAAHPGQFNETEIKRLANQTPSILTTIIRYTDDDHDINFVSWVLYRADSKDRLYDGALKLVSSLIPVIKNLDAQWSIGGGERVEAECLYSGSLDQINITLWGVKWKWKVQELENTISFSDLDYFEGYDATHKIKNALVLDEVNMEVLHASTD